MKKLFSFLLSSGMMIIYMSCQSDYDNVKNLWTNVNYQKDISRSSNSEGYFRSGWEYLSSHSKKIAALQLSESLLNSISTEELVDICMSYPLALDCFAFNSIELGINHVISNFNGFAILRSRTDALEKMLDFYNKKLDEIELLGSTIVYDINPLKLAFYEQFLISGYLCPIESLAVNNDFKNAVIKARALRNSFPALQGYISVESLKAMEKIIGTDGNESLRSPSNANYMTIYTPKGVAVEAIKFVCNDNSAENISGLQYIENNYPTVEIIADASCTYNCHAYAWYVYEGGERVWINQKNRYEQDNVSKFWSDGSYIETTLIDAQKAFDPVNDHSAIVLEDGKYLSKWGAYQLVRHNLQDCPYWDDNINNIKYYDYPYKEGIVYWDMDPDPTPINSYEDFYIEDIYDPEYYSIEIFVSSTKEPTEPATGDVADIVSHTNSSAKVYFKKYGIYHICFKVKRKSSGNYKAFYISSEVYVLKDLMRKPNRNKKN